MLTNEPQSEILHLQPEQSTIEPLGRVAMLENQAFSDYFRTALGAGGSEGVDTDKVDELAEQAAQQREAILALPSWEEGLNMERVDAFCEREGIPPKPLRVLAPEDYQVALRIAGGGVGSHDETEGRFLSALDVVVVQRDPEAEALNGSGYTESLVVHERKHAATKLLALTPQTIVERRGTLRRRSEVTRLVGKRVGFETTSDSGNEQGKALEEGSAEMARGKYIVEELGMPDGFVDKEPGQTSNPLHKYLSYVRQSSGKVAIAHPKGAIPAVLLEALCRRDPELPAVLKQGHESFGGLTALAQRLDDIHPKLYQKIMNVDLSASGGQKQVLGLIAEVFS
jgi:hypothetical protein